ncbi:MAG: hypothetical protein U9O94_05605, partial [Nanoarchaeota archaeon]|nr:hypothetical protein [Nanoarchaeota archaeon]
MKTKYMLLVSLLIILSASIVSAETKHLFVVGDDSSTSDVISVTDVSLYVQGMIGTNYETKLSSQVTRDMLEDKVTTFVYKGQGLIIVGENSPSDHVILATEIEAFLENNRGVNARIMINTEVTSDDLIEAIGWTEKELSVIMVSSPESKGGEAKIKKGDSIVFTAKPSDLEGDYTRAFFFDMSMFTCSNTEWEMTCTSKKDGVGNVYVEIYKNNKKYKSNVIRVVVGDSNSVEPIEHEFKDILSEKASKTYTVDGVDYDITVTSISDNSRVQFKVNGEFTRVMFVGDVYALSDTSQIQVLSIDEDDAGRDIVEFAFKGKSTEFTLIKKGFTGGSFEDIITEGETRTYTVNGVDYEISSLDADFS